MALVEKKANPFFTENKQVNSLKPPILNFFFLEQIIRAIGRGTAVLCLDIEKNVPKKGQNTK